MEIAKKVNECYKKASRLLTLKFPEIFPTRPKFPIEIIPTNHGYDLEAGYSPKENAIKLYIKQNVISRITQTSNSKIPIKTFYGECDFDRAVIFSLIHEICEGTFRKEKKEGENLEDIFSEGEFFHILAQTIESKILERIKGGNRRLKKIEEERKYRIKYLKNMK